MIIFAETERLILREFLPADEEAYFEMDSNHEVHRYPGIHTRTGQQHELWHHQQHVCSICFREQFNLSQNKSKKNI